MKTRTKRIVGWLGILIGIAIWCYVGMACEVGSNDNGGLLLLVGIILITVVGQNAFIDEPVLTITDLKNNSL